MKIEVNITKKRFFILLFSVFLVLGGIFVYAYNSNPADPAVFGHSLDEIEGLDDRIRQIVSEEIAGLDSSQYICSSTPAYSFSSLNTKEQKAIVLPEECKTSSSSPYCVIKQELYNYNTSGGAPKLSLVRNIQFSQDSSSGVWWSSYQGNSQTGSTVNGDSTSTDVAPSYTYSSGWVNSGTVRLIDDATSGSIERNKGNITVKDDSQWTGTKIYFCTFSG